MTTNGLSWSTVVRCILGSGGWRILWPNFNALRLFFSKSHVTTYFFPATTFLIKNLAFDMCSFETAYTSHKQSQIVHSLFNRFTNFLWSNQRILWHKVKRCPLFFTTAHWWDPWWLKAFVQDSLGNFSENSCGHGSRQRSFHWPEPVLQCVLCWTQLWQANKHAFLWLEKGKCFFYEWCCHIRHVPY